MASTQSDVLSESENMEWSDAVKEASLQYIIESGLGPHFLSQLHNYDVTVQREESALLLLRRYDPDERDMCSSLDEYIETELQG